MAPAKSKGDKKGKAPRKRGAGAVKAKAPAAAKLPSDTEDFHTEEDVAMLVDAAAGTGMELDENVELKPAAKKASEGKRRKKNVPIIHVEDWNNMLFEALVYRAEHGDFNIGAKDKDYQNAFEWMQEQRKQFKAYQKDPASSTLTPDQVEVLNSLNFHWHTRGEEHWNRSYELLKQFQKENGHCLASRTNKGSHKLGDFVTEQRRQYKLQKEGKPTRLTPRRKALLDELGFVWQVRQRTGWQDRFDELVQFKDQYKTTAVPQVYPENRPLGKWVAKQREQYRLLQAGKHSFLTPDRLQQLNRIGFLWQVQGRGRPVRFDGPTIEGGPQAAAAAAVAAAAAAGSESAIAPDAEDLVAVEELTGASFSGSAKVDGPSSALAEGAGTEAV